MVVMVVSTTISDGGCSATVMAEHLPAAHAVGRAASTMSPGIALIDADRIVIAKPAWIQIRSR